MSVVRMTLVLRGASCVTWAIPVSATTQPRPATLPPGVSPARYASVAARAVGVDVERIFGRERSAPVALARQLAMVAARRGGHSLSEIGRVFDRNHSTVLYAQHAYEDRARRDPTLAGLLDWIIATASAGPDDGDREPPRIVRPARRRRARRPPRRAPAARVDEPIGAYGSRRLLLGVLDGARVLLDCRSDGADERVVERFGPRATAAQVQAVTDGYLAEARALGRPVDRSAP